MAWTTTSYSTLAQIKSAIDPNMSTNDDSWLTDMMGQAQDLMDDYVGYPFQTDGSVGTPATRVMDGVEAMEMRIFPCQQLTQVLESIKNTYLSAQTGIWTSGSTITTDITADVVLGPSRLVQQYKPGISIKRLSGIYFSEGVQNYTLKGVWGYSSIPKDITRAHTRIVIHWYRMRDTSYSDLITEQGGIRERYTKNLPTDVVEILDRYKPRVFMGGAQGAW